jgi:multidrug efflux pump subunit AcrA (membrane-fusion protein)
MMRLSVFSAGILLLLSLGCTKKPVTDKKYGVISRQDIVQKISIDGTVRGLRQTDVQAGYSGYVGKIYVNVGDKVKEGQQLVRITQTIDQPLTEVYPIRAPFAGTITQILKREGEYLAASGDSKAGVMILSDLTEFWVDATVPEVDIAKIAIGHEAVIRANALPGKTYPGKVERLSLSPKASQDRWDRGRVEYPTEIRITGPDENLRAGMSVVVDVISARSDKVLSARHEFVHKDKDGFFVIDDKGTRHPVVLGISNEEVVEISSGAAEGMKIEMMDFSRK